MIVTKKFMKLGTVNIPVGTKIDGLPEGIENELVTRALVDIVKPEPEKKHKKEKTEAGF